MLNNQKKSIRVGIVGNSGCIHNSFAMSTEQLFKEPVGGNTGNLAFRYAVTNHIASEKLYLSWNSDPAWVREACDLLVFPAANHIKPTRDHTPKADFIEAVDLPCLILGLGAQASRLGDEIRLKEGSIRWLKAIAERSHLIGVRGEYTADVLARMGINNTIILGCPSHFINPLPTLGEVIEKKLYHTVPQNLVVTAGNPAKLSLKRVERKLMDWLRKYRGAYVCQSPQDLVSLARNCENEISEDHLTRYRQYLQPSISRYLQPRSKFIAFARKHFRTFFDAGAWLEFLSSFDLSIGTRMHGNLLSVQASTPAICIHHDSRTQELSNVTSIPHLSISKFLAARNIREAAELVSFEGRAFDKNRVRLASEYRELLIKNGIAVGDVLDSLTKS
ncbi:MAG: polysaccharide pyruvyl transferase family protein [Cyanobacteria bacterium P01_D01_bin.44]